MSAVPEYTRKAINKYNAKFDRISINLPKGTKERIKERTDKSYNEYIKTLISANLDGEKQPMQDMEIKSKPWKGGERIQYQITAKLKAEILRYSDSVDEFLKQALDEKLSLCRQNAENAKISTETGASDNLSMWEEKPKTKEEKMAWLSKPKSEMTPEERKAKEILDNFDLYLQNADKPREPKKPMTPEEEQERRRQIIAEMDEVIAKCEAKNQPTQEEPPQEVDNFPFT